jgi:PAS domain S-box-containing protein
MAGIFAGFVIWFYTLLMPALIKAEVISSEGLVGFLLRHDFLNPHGLFGLKGLDKWSHSLFWGLTFNLVCYVGFSLFTAQKDEEERQGLLFVESYDPKLVPKKSLYTIRQIEDILGQYVGKVEAQEIIGRSIRRQGINRQSITQDDLVRLRGEAERILSGVLGSSIATIIFEDKSTLTEEERGELSTSIRQITDTLRLSRHELAEANRNLAYLKEFSENIIESAPLGIITVDSKLAVKYWNREMENITGVKRAVAINRSIQPLLPWVHRGAWTLGEQKELIAQTSVNQTIKVNISPFKDPSGGLVIILENITEKKKMEEQLLQTSKLASLGQLTAGISHEIGNPLASISSLVQELQSLELNRSEDIEFTRDSLQTINNHLARIATIVRSLGDFARISSSEKKPTNINELLDQTVNLVKYDKRSRKIEFITQADPIPLLQVNPDQIQQVFLNLALNAIDAMPEGGRLEVNIRRVDSSVLIRFIDSGSGIEEAELDRIFDPFFTTKLPGKGTGLGLSICYGIIKDHNGQISVKSKKGSGTTFEVRLPMEESDG